MSFIPFRSTLAHNSYDNINGNSAEHRQPALSVRQLLSEWTVIICISFPKGTLWGHLQVAEARCSRSVAFSKTFPRTVLMFSVTVNTGSAVRPMRPQRGSPRCQQVPSAPPCATGALLCPSARAALWPPHASRGTARSAGETRTPQLNRAHAEKAHGIRINTDGYVTWVKTCLVWNERYKLLPEYWVLI